MSQGQTTPRRTVHLSVRYLPEEIERVRVCARARGLAPSSFVRFLSLGEKLAPVEPDQTYHDLVAHLRRALGGLGTLSERLDGRAPVEDSELLRGAVGEIEQALGRLVS